MSVKKQPKKVLIEQEFLVLQKFTLDKVYHTGDSIKLSKKEQIEQLLTQKYIK